MGPYAGFSPGRSLSCGSTIEAILIVEGDEAVQKKLKRLRGDGRSALEAFRRVAPTGIVLDLRLPTVSGKDVCWETRRISTVPIIVGSAVAEKVDKIISFGDGR